MTFDEPNVCMSYCIDSLCTATYLDNLLTLQ